MSDEQINELAENLDCGLKCFVHIQTKAILAVPDTTNEPNGDSELWDEDNEELENNSSSYIEIEKMDGTESFRIMEGFIETVDDLQQKEIFEKALMRPKPFRNFKFEIDNSGSYRQKWFDFKKQHMIEWVKRQVAASKL
jgi:hypothetical protein